MFIQSFNKNFSRPCHVLTIGEAKKKPLHSWRLHFSRLGDITETLVAESQKYKIITAVRSLRNKDMKL